MHNSIVWNYFFFHTEKPRSSYRYMYLDWISAYYSKFLEAGVISDWFWSCLYNLKKEHQLTICKVWYELIWLHYEKNISTKSVENWLLYKQKTENTIFFYLWAFSVSDDGHLGFPITTKYKIKSVERTIQLSFLSCLV